MIRRCKIMYLIFSIRYFHNDFVDGNLSETPLRGTSRARLRPPAHSYPKPTAAKPSLWVHHDAVKIQVTTLFSPHAVHFCHCCNHSFSLQWIWVLFFSDQGVLAPNVLGVLILHSIFFFALTTRLFFLHLADAQIAKKSGSLSFHDSWIILTPSFLLLNKISKPQRARHLSKES